MAQLKVTCGFGYRIHPVTGRPDFHTGVDFAARGELVFAILDGIVSGTGYNAILGNFVRIDHGGLTSIYGHLSNVFVSRGDEVSCGRPVGLSGSTGRATGEHLHLSIRLGGSYVDPLRVLLRLQMFINHSTKFYGI